MTPGRRLGQHFLTDKHILKRIVDALDPTPGEVVLEIGAGMGSLTDALLARGLRVIAIEKDRRLVERLRARGDDRASALMLVAGDALRLNWHGLVAALPGPAPAASAVKLVGNIPYHITSPLIERALTPPLPERIVFLLQAEVADRAAAAPGSRAYGALSVGVQALARVERLFRVHAGAFHPPPRVASALLRLTPLAEPLVRPEEVARFRTFVTACFSRRRKQLKNAVMGATGQPAAVVLQALRALELDPVARPETLPPAAFVRLLRWRGRL